MYKMSDEDKKILENYRNFMKKEISNSDDEDFNKVISKSVELLEGEITSDTLKNYLEVQVKNSKNTLEGLSESSLAKMKDIRLAAKEHGVVEVVKRYQEGINS